MSVVFSVLGGGASEKQFAFQDSFIRTPATDLGSQWGICEFSNDGPFVNLASIVPSIATLVDAVSGFHFGVIGQNNPQTIFNCFVYPTPVYSNLYGINQFVQATFIQSVGLSGGPALLFSASDVGAGAYSANGYYITKDGFIERVNNNVVSDVNGVSFGIFVQNDVMRVSVDIQATQNVFTVSQNGIFLATVTDSTINRLLKGSPGLAGILASGTVANDKCDWRTFSCGRGV